MKLCAGLLLMGALEAPVETESIRVAHFEDLAYPLRARLSHVEGAVVVRVKINGSGEVTDAGAISGAKLLIPDVVANAKKWRFFSDSARVAVLVYDFRFEGMCSAPCPSHLVFRPPNRAYVTVGEPVAGP